MRKPVTMKELKENRVPVPMKKKSDKVVAIKIDGGLGRVIALLSISDTPIEDLVSYLK